MALSNKEEWRIVSDNPNYQVSNKGRIKSNITGNIIHA